MSDFQVLIVPAEEGNASEDESLQMRPHSGRSARVIDSITELESVWDTVIERLTALADKSNAAADRSPFELSSIEFNIGIEAGLSIGLVTKGNASVSVAFTRKEP